MCLITNTQKSNNEHLILGHFHLSIALRSIQTNIKEASLPLSLPGEIHGEMVISIWLGGRCHTDQPPN